MRKAIYLLSALSFASPAVAQITLPVPAITARPKAAAPVKTDADPARKERERDLARANEPMKFQRVRSASLACAPDCPEWISAEGRIIAGVTANQLKRILAGLGDSKLPIFIHSAGGAVEESYAMGRMIRAKGLAVSVTKSEILDCAPADKDCRARAGRGIKPANPKPHLSVCASSCVFVLAGGVHRHVGPLSLVGVLQFESRVTHIQVLQKYRMVPDARTGVLKKEVISEERVSQKTVKTRTRDEVYDTTTAFFREMGVASETIMAQLKATPHDSMHWLSPAEVSATRIATDRRTGPQVIGLSSAAGVDPSVLDLLMKHAATPPQAPSASALAMKSAAASGALLPQPAPSGSDPVLIRAIQQQLKFANCLGGGVDSVWQERQRRAAARFATAGSLKLDATSPSEAMLTAVTRAARPNLCAQPAD